MTRSGIFLQMYLVKVGEGLRLVQVLGINKILLGLMTLCLILSGQLTATPKDQRIEIVHIANIRGDHAQLARLLTYKDSSKSEVPTLYLVGTDVTGISAFSEVDPDSKIFLQGLKDLASGNSALFLPGRSDLAQAPALMRKALADLKRAGFKVLATNYAGPLKGVSEFEVLRLAGGARIAVLSILAQDTWLKPHKILDPQSSVKRVLNSLDENVDGVVIVTNLKITEQRSLAKMIGGLRMSSKVLGVFGADPREKSAEVFSSERAKFLIHQASSASKQLTRLSVYWHPDSERDEKFTYENLPEVSRGRQKPLQALDKKLQTKFPDKVGEVLEPLYGPVSVDALFQGTSTLGAFIANALRSKGIEAFGKAETVLGVYRGGLIGKAWPAGPLSEADLVKTFPLDASIRAIQVSGKVLEAMVRQDLARQASRQGTALEWSDNLRVSDGGAITINRRKIDPNATYHLVADSVLLGGQTTDGRVLIPSTRGKELLTGKTIKDVTPAEWSRLTERGTVRDFVRQLLDGSIRDIKKTVNEAVPPLDASGLPLLDPKDSRYLPLTTPEIERIRAHPHSVIWLESFPENQRPQDVLIVDVRGRSILGVARVVSFGFGNQEEVLKGFGTHTQTKWNEENSGPRDKGKYYGVLLGDYKPFPKPIELDRVTDATHVKQFTLRNRVQRETLEWLKAKGLVAERSQNQTRMIKNAMRMFGDLKGVQNRLDEIQSRSDADIALSGVYHLFAEPAGRVVVFEVSGKELKRFFKTNDRRLFQAVGLKFNRQGQVETVGGEPISDRKKYRIASEYSAKLKTFNDTFAQGGKAFALETIRETATEKALVALKAVVEASEEAGISAKSTKRKKKKKDEDAEDGLVMRPIRHRTKEVRRALYDKGALIFPDGERIDTGGEIEEMPEDILFQRHYQKLVDRLNPYDPKSVEEIQKAVAILAQLEVISRLTPESLQLVRENTTYVQDLLVELGTLNEEIRNLFRNPLITLRLKGYRPTVEEADLLTRYYAAKPTDYEPLFERWVEFKPMVEVLREKLRVTPTSFFTSPSSTTLQHHDPIQHFPDGQAVHDQNVLNLLARRLELEGYDKPVIEAVILGMLAHDGWSHEPSPTNWFFKQFGLAGSQAVLKGGVDLMTLFFPDFEDFLTQHPNIKREELELFAKQFEEIKKRLGKVPRSNLRTDIKRMMLASPFLALSDLSAQQETWFIKNLAAYISVQVVGPKAYRNVQELMEKGVQEFSVREIVRRLIDEEFGGLDGAQPNERSVLSRQRKAFTPKGAKWIEDKVLDYVLCNAFGPLLEKRFDFSSTFMPVSDILKQNLPQIPADELAIVHRMVIAEPTFRQPYGKELGRGGWDIGHAARLRAEMARHIPMICQRIRAKGEEQLWLERYSKYFGNTLEEIFDHIHDIAAGHMGAYQLAPEVIHRIYVNAGVDPSKLTHKPWTWTDVGGYLYNPASLQDRVTVKANQADTLEALGYLAIERGLGSIPDKDKIRVTREVSLSPKEGFVPVDKIRAAPRGRVFKEFKKETGGTLESQEHLRQWVKVTLRDWRGRDITSDPRLAHMLHDFIHQVPGELDAKYAINAPALLKKAEDRKKLKERKRQRAEKESTQDDREKDKAQHYRNVLQALADTDAEALDRLEEEFGIPPGEIKKLLKVREEPDWIEFIRNRARLVSRLDSLTENSRPSHKATKSKSLSSAQLALRVAADRVSEIRTNEETSSRELQEEIASLRREKEAVYLADIRAQIDANPKRLGFLEAWSPSSMIGFKLACERLGEDIVLKAIKNGANAGVFDVLYNGNFSFPLFGEEGAQALDGLVLFVNEASEGRLDGAHSVVRTLRRDPVRVMNFFRRFRVVQLAGVRGIKKMAADCALSPTHVIGADAVLEEAVDRWGIERIAGFEVPFEIAGNSKESRAVRVADIVLKPEKGKGMDEATVIEVKNYSTRSFFEYLQSSLLPQFRADAQLFAKNIMRVYWVFRGVSRETGHVVKLFEEIMREAKIPRHQIKTWLDEHLIFRGESGFYPPFDSSQLDDLRLEGCRALNEKWYQQNPVLEDQRVKENLDVSIDAFQPELKFNWAKANQEGEDIGADLVQLIRESRKSLKIATYDLEQEDVVEELVRAAGRLKPENIFLTLEGSNFQDIPWRTAAEVEAYLDSLPQWQRSQFLEEHAGGAEHMSQAQLDRLHARNDLRLARLRKLKKAGIQPKMVKNRDQIMHVKVVIRDSQEALVLTANPTDSDLYGDFDSSGRKKLAPANVNASMRIKELPIVQFMESELDQLHRGLTTKTSRDLSSATQTFADKGGERITIGFTPFSGQGDMANTLQGVLSGLSIEEIYVENFSFSDARLWGILYPHIEKGAKRHILVDDHFMKFYSKAWQALGIQTRDPQGHLVVDRVTRLPLEAKPLGEGEYVGSWNGRIDEMKGLEAKMHLKLMAFKASRPGKKEPVYILSYGSGNASRLGMTTNNEIWIFYETTDPAKFYEKVREHFSQRQQDTQAFDLSKGIEKALILAMADSKPKTFIDYLQADDFGKRPTDALTLDASALWQSLLSSPEPNLKAFSAKLEAEAGIKLRVEAQILMALWLSAPQKHHLSELVNLLDVVMIPETLKASREYYLRKLFDDQKLRDRIHRLAELVGGKSEDLMSFVENKSTVFSVAVKGHLRAEILKLQGRERNREVFFSAQTASLVADDDKADPVADADAVKDRKAGAEKPLKRSKAKREVDSKCREGLKKIGSKSKKG